MTSEERLQAARETFENLHAVLRPVLGSIEPNLASIIGAYLIELRTALSEG